MPSIRTFSRTTGLITLLLVIMAKFSRALRSTVLVTGATDGIGLTTAKNLAAKGYNVILHGRDPKRIETACETVRSFVVDWSSDSSVEIEAVRGDLSTMSGCEGVATKVKDLCEKKGLALTVLMNNAGVYAEELTITPDQMELTFAVNVLAPFIITSHLLPLLLKNKSRIVIASSISQSGRIRDWDDLNYDKQAYSAHGSYAESKLLDAMLANEFAERLQKKGYGTDRITCNSLDPGTVNTKMLLAGWGPIGIDVEDALDQTYLCSDPELDEVSGQYFRWRTSSQSAYSPADRSKLWSILSKLAPSAAKAWE